MIPTNQTTYQDLLKFMDATDQNIKGTQLLHKLSHTPINHQLL